MSSSSQTGLRGLQFIKGSAHECGDSLEGSLTDELTVGSRALREVMAGPSADQKGAMLIGVRVDLRFSLAIVA